MTNRNAQKGSSQDRANAGQPGAPSASQSGHNRGKSGQDRPGEGESGGARSLNRGGKQDPNFGNVGGPDGSSRTGEGADPIGRETSGSRQAYEAAVQDGAAKAGAGTVGMDRRADRPGARRGQGGKSNRNP